eukprot:366436-Chlamydomonas_euryale.AAC.37
MMLKGGGGAPAPPFPPPQGSALARAVAAIRAQRRISPRVRYVRDGDNGDELFYQLLLDEADDAPASPAGSAGGGTGGNAFGLAQFVEHVCSEVAVHLSTEVEPDKT